MTWKEQNKLPPFHQTKGNRQRQQVACSTGLISVHRHALSRESNTVSQNMVKPRQTRRPRAPPASRFWSTGTLFRERKTGDVPYRQLKQGQNEEQGRVCQPRSVIGRHEFFDRVQKQQRAAPPAQEEQTSIHATSYGVHTHDQY